MKKKKIASKKQSPSDEIYPGKQMIHGNKRCIVGDVREGSVLISYPGEVRSACIVRADDLRAIPVDE